jgi:hypothetical protein
MHEPEVTFDALLGFGSVQKELRSDAKLTGKRGQFRSRISAGVLSSAGRGGKDSGSDTRDYQEIPV